MFGRLRIQLLTVFLIFGVINLFLIILYNFESNRKSQIEEIEDHIHGIEILIYKDAQQINNFFTFETRSSSYFQTHRSDYLEQHHILINQVEREVDALILLNVESLKSLNNSIAKIHENLDSLSMVIDKIMNLIYLRGFKDYGIEGDMRDHAHTLEATKGVELSDLLMLRRHEKDYIIRNEAKYIQKFHERLIQMKVKLNTNSDLSHHEKMQINSELDKYLATFTKMVEIDHLVGIKDNTGMKAELESIINQLLLDSETLNNVCRAYKLKTYKKIRNASILILVGIIAMAILLSMKLSKLITRRISMLSENISEFIDSCFTKLQPVGVKIKKDEVGILINNFEFLKQKIFDQLNYLELKVQERTEEINLQKEHILDQNTRLIDSLKYAMNIQEAMLPCKSTIGQTFSEHFIFFRPKDLVSGDFYWFKRIQNCDLDISIIAVVDCTGHGVPGAFMSMLGIASLNDIIIKKDTHTTANILNKLRRRVINNLTQHNTTKKVADGMDVALTIIDHRKRKLQFSGAYRDLYLIRNQKLEIIKGDRMPIGKNIKEETDFSFIEFDYFDDDVIYMFTDGFADQFGGVDNRKYLRKNLQQLLIDMSHYSMEQQKKLISIELNSWMQKGDQTDDILLAGFKL